MSGFSVDWLDLREDADRRARDPVLRAQAGQWLADPDTEEPLVVDLGAGTGATLRALSSATPQSPGWRLVDLDAGLLKEAWRRHGAVHRIETCNADLSRVAQLPLAGARLVTASALFDLVSAAFLQDLAAVLQAQCRRQPVALYSALNYDGLTRWYPAHPLDQAVLAAFNRDQQRDKGFGPALGPDAGAGVRKAFTAAGFRVDAADSPWRLTGEDHLLVSALIEGIAAAVRDDAALTQAGVSEWAAFRKEHVRSGTCEVGHTDLLIRP